MSFIKTKSKTRVLGLALGSGGARGMAHVGVLRALREADLEPDVIAGTSAGSIVAAAYASNRLNVLEQLAEVLDWRLVAKLFFEFGFKKDGLLRGTRIMQFLGEIIPAEDFGALRIPAAIVATDLENETEVVFQSGSVHHAIRASIAIPGVFTPVSHEGRLLADGGLVNPVPVSAARALGATNVIAVDINTSTMNGSKMLPLQSQGEKPPSLFTILTRSFRLYENTITRAQLRQSPPDILVAPPVGHIPTLDFLHAREAISAGYHATLEALGNNHRQEFPPSGGAYCPCSVRKGI